MNRFVVLLFLVDLAVFNCSVIHNKIENTFYDALEKKCDLIKKFEDFQTQDVFERCMDWNKISNIQYLSEDTEKNFLCLLYFDSFNVFCSEAIRLMHTMQEKQVTIAKPYFMPVAAIMGKTIEDICKNLSLIPSNKTYEHNVTKILLSDVQCLKLCSTYEINLEIECAMAYYFNNLDVEKIIEIKSVETKPVDIPANSLAEAKAVQGKENIPHDSPTVPKVKIVENQMGKVTSTNPDTAKTGGSKVDTQNDGDKLEETPAKEAKLLKNTLAVQEVPQPVKTPEQKPSVGDKAIVTQQVVVPKEVKKEETTVKEEAVKIPEASKPVLVDETEKQADITVDNNKGKIEMPPKEPLESVIPNPDPGSDLEEISPTGQDEMGNDGEGEEEEKEDQGVKKDEQPKNKNKDKNSDSSDMIGNNPQNSISAVDIEGESYFFSYFMAFCFFFVLGYVGYHNRQKVMALVVEGKRGKKQYRGRRPNSANYHKLDSNLEEAISSTCTKNSSHVIY